VLQQKTGVIMTKSLGIPTPDCAGRRLAARQRREGLFQHIQHAADAPTMLNGEEVDYGFRFATSYHKALPHDVRGFVHTDSYHAMVRVLSSNDAGLIETLPLGANRSAAGPDTPTNPRRYAQPANGPNGKPLGYRQMTSPLTGHVYDVEGADAGAFTIGPSPLLASEEAAAEMAELYLMALLRDCGFTEIANGACGGVNLGGLFNAIKAMSWFAGSYTPKNPAERRRFDTRLKLTSPADLFRGSTQGSQAGPWLSQYLLIGNETNAGMFLKPDGSAADPNSPTPQFRGTRAVFGREDGFVLFGTQIMDQRSIVAQEGLDYLTNWAAWLDAQNGVDFNNFDRLRDRRRFLFSPRDIATYVHYDALYQAYLVACLIMLASDRDFPKGAGLPETRSRTRGSFASFGGPHILSLVTEVATRALKAVWRQKWLHHRRARPEVVAALLTLHENDPAAIDDQRLKDALAALRGFIPTSLLTAIAAHNTNQNQNTIFKPLLNLPTGFPNIADGKNYLLPMAFPEGSPTHPSYGAGHATVAGACVTILKAFFDMYGADGGLRPWPYDVYASKKTPANEGGELLKDAAAPGLTVAGELDKLAANIAIARNMAGVHYYTDYYESLRLGERIAVSILEEQLSMYGEPVAMRFPSFDGDDVRVQANGGAAAVVVYDDGGRRTGGREWYSRYED
jgi:hypothetical protein